MPELVRRVCPKHGECDYYVFKHRIRCKQCQIDSVTSRRRRVREILVAEHGGTCSRCGYSRCKAALEFHHKDPSQKDPVVLSSGNTNGIATMRAEAAKCILVCANCHREIHEEMGHGADRSS